MTSVQITDGTLILNTLHDYHIKCNTKGEYSDLICAFDIETTSEALTDDNTPRAYMYIWQMCVNGICFYGRNWKTFHRFVDGLCRYAHIGIKHKLVVYVHNLSYEYQFIKKRFDWFVCENERKQHKYSMALENRKIVKATTKTGIQFRCSYLLSNYSMKNLIKNCLNIKDEYKGDLDYSVKRNGKTPLTEIELNYCLKDTYYLYLYIKQQLEQYGSYSKIPNTSTGVVRNIFKEEIKNDRRYKALMERLTLTTEQYQIAKNAFMGGYTHASEHNIFDVHHNVSSYDFTSSYPAVMVAEQYPMTTPIEYTPKSETDFNLLVKKGFGVIGCVVIEGLYAKYHEYYISESKCLNRRDNEFYCINGRVAIAKRVIMYVTEIDIDIIRQCYEYDKITFVPHHTMVVRKAPLPDTFLKVLLGLIDKKNRLKPLAKQNPEYIPEYNASKARVNSCYGMCVMDILRDHFAISEDGEVNPEIKSPEESITENNNSKTRFTYYLWGIYVTAYARRNLWKGIIEYGDDYIYSDTDSVKVLNYDRESHIHFINNYNRNIRDSINTVKNRILPEANLGNLGEWDFEGTYEVFKTLGAKRYLYSENGHLHLTCAGWSKSLGSKYLEQCNEPFDIFNTGLTVPSEYSGRQISRYIDDELIETVTDDYGNVDTVHELSYLHLDNSEYSLSIGELMLQIAQLRAERGKHI